MKNEEEFVASLKALFIRYHLTVIESNLHYYLRDSDGHTYCLSEFLQEMVDSE